MALSPGTRLGRYEIRAVIGAGGMGAVYQAHDTTLKRDVALKVVLEEFATDADRLRRFEREALATAALNHPNILAVYDVGTHDGTTYVVSELLEGKTLREALSTGPLPARRAARYAAQIADGLAAAHDKSIIHRDIKPANLFVTSDDRVKILDFGLARVGNPSSPDEGATATATGLTMPGLILGSAGYMAPEQVRGAAVDHRADIFSLGAVLYEMLAGRRAFHRDTVAGTLAAIVETDPPSSSGDGSAASQRLMRLVRRCLEKVPAQRFQSARDLAHVLADESGDEPLDAAASGSRRLQWRPIAITALLTTAVIAGFALWVWPGLGRDTAPPAQGPVEIEVSAPDGTDGLRGPVLSNDGRTLAFIAGRRSAPGRIYIRDIAARSARPLEGTNGAAYPFFSPDGRRIAFFASGQLKIAPVDDGAPFVVCQTGLIRGGTWTDDDAIVFAENGKGLSQVSPSAGATPTALTSLNTDEKDHRAPHALPNAAGIVFTLNYQAGGYRSARKIFAYLLRPGAETAEPLPLAVTRSAYGRISPDSRWLAYTNGDSDQSEVYVTAYPPGGRPWQVSQAGSGQRLAWAKSGSDLYLLRNDGEVMVVSIGPSGPTGGPRSAGVGKFPLGGAGAGDPQYHTLPGGRFVVVRDVAESSPTQPIVVVLNRVPAAPR